MVFFFVRVFQLQFSLSLRETLILGHDLYSLCLTFLRSWLFAQGAQGDVSPTPIPAGLEFHLLALHDFWYLHSAPSPAAAALCQASLCRCGPPFILHPLANSWGPALLSLLLFSGWPHNYFNHLQHWYLLLQISEIVVISSSTSLCCGLVRAPGRELGLMWDSVCFPFLVVSNAWKQLPHIICLFYSCVECSPSYSVMAIQEV